MPSLRQIGSWFGRWVALLGLYLLFASKLSAAEAVVGAVAASLAATAATVTAKAGFLRFKPRLLWLLRLARLPWKVLVDCGVVGAALWRRLGEGRTVEGQFRTVPFDPGSEDAESAARRAIVTAGVSLAPNTYVLAIDRQHGLLFVHQLVPSARPPGGGDREWPL